MHRSKPDAVLSVGLIVLRCLFRLLRRLWGLKWQDCLDEMGDFSPVRCFKLEKRLHTTRDRFL